MPLSNPKSISDPLYPNGVATAFPFDFAAVSEDEVVVLDAAYEPISSGLYSVFLDSDDEGGSVLFSAAPTALAYPVIYIASMPAFDQPANFDNSGPSFDPSSLTKAVDDAAVRDLALKRDIDSALRLGPGEEPARLPIASLRANKFVAFDASGDPLMSSGTGADAGLRTDMADSTGWQLLGAGESTLDGIIVKTPQEFGASTVGDATTALQAFLDALGDGVHGRWDGGPYTISSRLNLLNKSNFQITGQCTIKMADGTPIDSGYSCLRTEGCTDFLVEGLTADANRTTDGGVTGRVPGESGGFNFAIINSHRGVFRRCKGINGTTDAWYFRGSNVNDISTYPTDITLEDCEGHNSYRNNCSVVGAVRTKIIRGRYCDANGAEPGAGIDLEPNTNDIHGVLDTLIDGTEVSGNTGAGITVTGNTGFSVTTNTTIRGVWGRDNLGVGGTSGVGAFMHLSASQNTTIENFLCLDHPDYAPGGTKGLIETSSNSLGVKIKGGRFLGITNTDPQCNCLHPTGPKTEISDVEMVDIACGGLASAGNDARINGVSVINSTFTGIAISIGGSRVIARNMSLRGHPGNYGFYCTAPNLLAENWYAEDVASTVAAIRFDSGTTSLRARGMHVHQTSGSVPAGASALRVDAAPLSLVDVVATGGYTTANTIFSANGLFAPTTMSGFNPNVLAGSSTYDAPSIAAGASATTNISVAKASIGDRAMVTPPASLGGLILEVPAVSVNGRVDFTLRNPTAAAIDLASGTWRAAVHKS